MPEITEGRYRGEFIYSEACGTLSLEDVVIDTGKLAAGTVLGKITKAAATGAAVAGNAGNGTITASPTVGAGAKTGIYRATCIEPGTNAGKFTVEDPEGVEVGVATVGVAFTGGGLTFTIADGATDFASGDTFTITVAEGSDKYVQLDPSAVDGSEVAAGILYDNVDATAGDVEAVMVARLAEVNGSEITWPAGITEQQKATAITQLKAINIIVR